MDKFEQIINQMTREDYLLIGIAVLLLYFLIHNYFHIKGKAQRKKTAENNIKVLQKSFDVSKDAMLILSAKDEVIYANKSMIQLFKLDKDYLLKRLVNTPKIRVRRDWMDLNSFMEENRIKLRNSFLSFPHVLLKVSENDPIPIDLYMDTVSEGTKSNRYYKIISIHNLREDEKDTSEQFRHQLTGLPNQIQALHDLPPFYSKAHLEKNKIALIMLNLDNFAPLRSLIGHAQADKILKKFAKYLAGIVSTLNISVYHTFDNYFLLTVTNLKSMDEARAFVEEIQLKLASFYKMEEVSLHLTVSAGIALYPDSGPTRNLLDNAYKALAKGEKDGDGRITVFIPEKFTKTYDELILHNDMQGGLSRGEFEVYYQPLIQVDSKEVVSAEALIRWKHPQYGLIPPDVFIGLMEKTGFIVKLGRFVLDEVLKQQKRWELFNFKEIDISINVSMVEIATGEFVQHVEKQLVEHQVNPELIKFEITEGMAMISEAETVKYFFELKKLGVGISLDDFGTGYTSFGYLKKFPADVIKIDKSLVDYILTNEEDQRIVKAMIELAHNLGMQIVVEGIENKKMVEMIASYGCDYMQGYYFAKPLAVFEFQKLLRV